ncbi:MAG: glycoside hydrolase domain-containing protein [Pirellulaceae bacterium]
MSLSLSLTIGPYANAYDGSIILSDQTNRQSAIVTLPITESPETLPNTVRFSVTLDSLIGEDRVQLQMNGRDFFGAIAPSAPNDKPRTGHFSGSIPSEFIRYGDNQLKISVNTARRKYQITCRNLKVEVTPWAVPYCQYRVPIEVDVPTTGNTVVNVTEKQLCTAIGAHEEYQFDPQFLAYNHLFVASLNEATNEHTLDPNAGFTLITHEDNLAATDPALPIPTEKGGYYLLTYDSVGGKFSPALPYEQTFPVGTPPRNHAYMSSYVPRLLPKAATTHECLLRSDGSDLKLLLDNLTTATNIRIQKANIALTASFEQKGMHKLFLYYQPMGAHYLKIPNRRMSSMPESVAQVTHVGESQKWLGNTRYRLPSVDGFEPWFAETTVKVTPQTVSPAQSRKSISITSAANESQSFQLILKPNIDFQIDDIQISSLRQGRNKITGVEVHQVDYVPVFKKAVINQVAFRGTIGDPLIPVQPLDRMASEGNVAYWFTIRTPSGTPPGEYTGTISISGSRNAETTIPISLVVRDFELTEYSPFKSQMGGQYIAKKGGGEDDKPVIAYHGISEKEDIQTLSNKYFEMMSREKFYPKTVALFTEIGMKWKAPPKGLKVDAPENFFELYDWDFRAFNKQMRHFINDLKVNSVCLTHTNPSISHVFKHLPGEPADRIRFHPGHTTMGWQTFRNMNQATYKTKPDGGWHDTCLEVSVEQWDRLVLDYYRAISRNLKKHGWLDKFYYFIDETSGTDQILHLIRLLKSDPETRDIRFTHCLQGFESLRHMEDGNYVFSEFITHVPQIDENYYRWEDYYFEDYDFPRDRDRLWGYAAYSSRLGINVPGMTNRQIGLEQFRNGASGYVIWDTFMWDHPYGKDNDPQNPWQEPYARLANGALSYFYPPRRDGIPESPDFTITPSLRVMTFRESVDDYEYARMLDDLIERAEQLGVDTAKARAVLGEISSMFPGTVEWTLNDAWYANLRDRMAESIVDLKHRLP